jgi:hypothetical protein
MRANVDANVGKGARPLCAEGCERTNGPNCNYVQETHRRTVGWDPRRSDDDGKIDGELAALGSSGRAGARGNLKHPTQGNAFIRPTLALPNKSQFANFEILLIHVQGPSPSRKKAHVISVWQLVSHAGVPPSSPLAAEPVGCPSPRYA